jgi:hypothetical protein
MRIFRRLLMVSLLAWLGGCNSSAPSAPTSPAPGSQPLPQSFVVSGSLFETADGVSRRLAERQVRLFAISTRPCDPPGSGCSTGTEQEHAFLTDANGSYTARVPTGSRVFAYGRDVSAPWQPCLASAVVDKDTTIDVQLVPVGSFLTPPAAASPMITGFVYEATSQGRQPLPGLVVWLEAGINGYLVAVTQTDQAGHFFLCRVNTPVWMGVRSRQEWFQSIPGTGDTSFEIELRR